MGQRLTRLRTAPLRALPHQREWENYPRERLHFRDKTISTPDSRSHPGRGHVGGRSKKATGNGDWKMKAKC